MQNLNKKCLSAKAFKYIFQKIPGPPPPDKKMFFALYGRSLSLKKEI